MSHRDDKKQVALKHHDVYFFPDGDLFVKVEDTLFRIDKHYLTRESTKLRSMILDPIFPSRDPPGSSETKPFPLDEATSEGFECLLWVFYNPDFTYDTTVDKWKQILFLAHHWGIARIARLCLRELAKLRMDPVEKIEFYQLLELNPNLLQASFVELTIRPEPLSEQEGERLGIKTSMRLARAREQARDPDRSRKVEEAEAEEVIEGVFGLHGSTPPSAITSPVREKENTTTDDQVGGGKRGKNRQGGGTQGGASRGTGNSNRGVNLNIFSL